MKLLDFKSNEQKLDQTKEQIADAVSKFVNDSMAINRPVRMVMVFESIEGTLGHIDYNLDGLSACVAAQVVNRLAQQRLTSTQD